VLAAESDGVQGQNEYHVQVAYWIYLSLEEGQHYPAVATEKLDSLVEAQALAVSPALVLR